MLYRYEGKTDAQNWLNSRSQALTIIFFNYHGKTDIKDIRMQGLKR